MNKKYSFLLLVVTCMLTSFTQVNTGRFEVIGKISGFADSTLIYLDDVTNSSPINIDSALVIQNQFHFSGSLKKANLVKQK